MFIRVFLSFCFHLQNRCSHGPCFRPTPRVRTSLEGDNSVWSQTLALTGAVASPSGAEYQDMEVNLRRQKSGFGFRVLGGDEAGQPVSPETREKVCFPTAIDSRYLFLSSTKTQTHSGRT